MSSETIYRIDDSEKETETPRASTAVRLRGQGLTITIALVTALLMSFTIFFGYNSSLQKPVLSLFVSKRPERSILILNVASNLTLFALAELTSSVCDTVRWAEAGTLIQYDAPGYQIDFSPIDEIRDPAVTLEDCHVYGLEGLAIQLCLKQSNSSIIAGNSPLK